MNNNLNLELLKEKFNAIQALNSLTQEAHNAQSVLSVIINDPQIRQRENLEDLKALAFERLELLGSNIYTLKNALNSYNRQ